MLGLNGGMNVRTMTKHASDAKYGKNYLRGSFRGGKPKFSCLKLLFLSSRVAHVTSHNALSGIFTKLQNVHACKCT